MKKIVAFFIRHGETDLNRKSDDNGTPEPKAEERFRGDLDVPLNDEGRQQAEDLVPYFAARRFSAAFHSGMKRTKETLEPLMKDKDMESVEVENLNNLDTGELAGQPKNKKNRKILEYYRKHPELTIPGGEKVNEFRKRADRNIKKAIEVGEESGRPSVTCIHGSIMREISRLLHDDYNKVKVDPGGVIGIYKSPQGYEAKPLLKESTTEEEIKVGS